MADQPNEKTKLPVTSMLALVAVVSGLVISQIPLKTSRPIGKEAENLVFVGDDRVQSRLWQDPFEAVDDHVDKEQQQVRQSRAPDHDHHHGLGDLASVIHRLAPNKPSFLIMPVMVDGSPYSKGVESRLRHRYALVSALGASEYLPEASEYLRFFRWCREPCDTASGPQPLIVPVEWYKPKPSLGKDVPQILIVWLKGQDFSAQPLAGLAKLVKDFREHFDYPQDLSDKPLAGLHQLPKNIKKHFYRPQLQFRILGPRGSGGLAAMVKEAKKFPGTFDALKYVEIFSSWATTEDTFLIGDPPKEPETNSTTKPCARTSSSLPPQPKTLESIFSDAKISLYRTIGADTLLAEQLIKELKLRGVDITYSCLDLTYSNHVALISEWDSLYGRVLPRTFVAVAQNEGKGDSSPDLEKHINTLRRDIWPAWAHHYSYLGGLDGELPPKDGTKDGQNSPSKEKGSDKTKGVPIGLERPEGRGQLDYVRRLAKTLQEAEAEIPGGYRAIGVLGSDVYDKLLILQALRPSFPQAIFFTTDLDAQLTHPNQWPWTKNLIVASHFGLKLREDLQQPIPPFRDSYQTALFFSVLQAIKDPWKRKVITDVSPRVYEIGRHGPFDLSPLEEATAPPSIHPDRLDLDPLTGRPPEASVSTMLKIGGAGFLILICVMLISSQVWDGIFWLVKRWWFWVVMVVGIGIVIGLSSWAMSNGAEGEPFVLTEGISVWPTQTLRFLSFLLCVVFFLYSMERLRNNEMKLREQFLLPGIPNDYPQGPWLQRLIGIHSWCSQPGWRTPIHQLWIDYLRLGRGDNRWLRFGLQALLYLLFGGLLMRFFGFPHIPCRGQACFSIDKLILIFSVLSMVLLIFFVVDATRLCRRLIKHLVDESIEWPEEFLEQEAYKRGVHKTCVHEWLCIDFIAQRTGVIGHLIYYPFVIVFLMAVARHPYFDHWDLPVSLAILIFLNVAYAFGNAVALRRSAEKARRAAFSQLKAKLLPLKDQRPSEQLAKRQIERAIDAIKNNHDGAFMHLTTHPLLGAIALPSGGYGLVMLMEYFSNAF